MDNVARAELEVTTRLAFLSTLGPIERVVA
jgi:hypothetical protein